LHLDASTLQSTAPFPSTVHVPIMLGMTGAAKAAEKAPAQTRVVTPAMASRAARGLAMEIATATLFISLEENVSSIP
jgi:hypothetical protein